MISRNDFPIFSFSKNLVYFDWAATTQKPSYVIEAMSQFYREEYATVHRAIYALSTHATQRYSNVRTQVASFLGAASPSEIVFTRGTTDSINLVANSFGRTLLQPGDEIIISEMEHHSNIVPWQMLQKTHSIQVKVIPIDDRGVLRLDCYEQLLSPRTKLVALAHIANSTGTLNPVAQIIASAHRVNAKVLIDGAQSAGHIPVDVQALDADFFAFSGHKLYGPTGIGILYGKQELLEQMPPMQGGGDMIEKVTLEETFFQRPPLRFEAGTPMIAEVIGLGAALSYIESAGISSITSQEQRLLQHATENLLKIPKVRLIGTAPEKGAIISFIVEGIHPLDLGTLLDLKEFAFRTGHLCAQPLLARFGLTALCRLSFSPANTVEEIDSFLLSLERAISHLT